MSSLQPARPASHLIWLSCSDLIKFTRREVLIPFFYKWRKYLQNNQYWKTVRAQGALVLSVVVAALLRAHAGVRRCVFPSQAQLPAAARAA